MNPIKKWNQLGLFTRIMVGFVLGIAAGLIFGEKATKLAFLGTILTRLLTMVVAPLVLGLLICSAADVKDFKTLGKIGGKTLGIFLGGTAIAVAIGLVLCNIMQIGAGFVMESAQAYDAKEIPSIVDTMMDIIPTNPFNSLSTQNLLQIIFFSLLLGFALIKLGEKGEPVLNFFRAWTEAWKEITNIVLEFTPYGVFGLMANIVGKYGMDVMLPYMKTIAACYITCALFTVFVQGGLMAGLYGGISPVRFFSVMKEAMLFVFATCSSVATIPLNLKCTKELGVSDKIADFVIPFGAVMNMNGTAIYEAVAVIFASQVFGIQLTLTQQIMVMVTAVLASVGTAGIPGSGLVMLTIVLNAVHLPLETIGLLAGIDRLLNMARVIPNIVGDAAAAVVVAKSEGELNTVGLKNNIKKWVAVFMCSNPFLNKKSIQMWLGIHCGRTGISSCPIFSNRFVSGSCISSDHLLQGILCPVQVNIPGHLGIICICFHDLSQVNACSLFHGLKQLCHNHRHIACNVANTVIRPISTADNGDLVDLG